MPDMPGMITSVTTASEVPLFREHFQRRRTVWYRPDAVTGALEEAARHIAHVGVVLD